MTYQDEDTEDEMEYGARRYYTSSADKEYERRITDQRRSWKEQASIDAENEANATAAAERAAEEQRQATENSRLFANQEHAVWLIAFLKKEWNMQRGRDYSYETITDKRTSKRKTKFAFARKAALSGVVEDAKRYVQGLKQEKLDLVQSRKRTTEQKDAARKQVVSAKRQEVDEKAKALADEQAKAEGLKARRAVEERHRRRLADHQKKEEVLQARREEEKKSRKQQVEKANMEDDAEKKKVEEERSKRSADQQASNSLQAALAKEKVMKESMAQRKGDLNEETEDSAEEEQAKKEAEEEQARKGAEEQARKAEERTNILVEHERAQAEVKKAVEEEARKAAEEQARKEAEEQARKEAEEQARKEAEEQARKEAEEQARKEVEEQARKEAEEQARKEAEEQARKEAEEQAKKEAEEEQARKEAEEQARQEADEEARKKGEDQARQWMAEQAEKEAEEQAMKEAEEEQARKQADEQARKDAEEQAMKEAEEQAKKEAEEEQARKEAEEQARKEAEEQVRKEAEEQAKKEAEEEQARKEAEEQAKKEAEEEQARKEAEEQANKEAAEQARKEAEEQANKEAAEQARKAAEEEQAKKEAEEQAKKEAEEQARKEAEEQARKEVEEEQERKDAEERARQRAEVEEESESEDEEQEQQVEVAQSQETVQEQSSALCEECFESVANHAAWCSSSSGGEDTTSAVTEEQPEQNAETEAAEEQAEEKSVAEEQAQQAEMELKEEPTEEPTEQLEEEYTQPGTSQGSALCEECFESVANHAAWCSSSNGGEDTTSAVTEEQPEQNAETEAAEEQAEEKSVAEEQAQQAAMEPKEEPTEEPTEQLEEEQAKKAAEEQAVDEATKWVLAWKWELPSSVGRQLVTTAKKQLSIQKGSAALASAQAAEVKAAFDKELLDRELEEQLAEQEELSAIERKKKAVDELVGLSVVVSFPGLGTFKGVVKRPFRGKYEVEMEDGDIEELTKERVEECLVNKPWKGGRVGPWRGATHGRYPVVQKRLGKDMSRFAPGGAWGPDLSRAMSPIGEDLEAEVEEEAEEEEESSEEEAVVTWWESAGHCAWVEVSTGDELACAVDHSSDAEREAARQRKDGWEAARAEKASMLLDHWEGWWGYGGGAAAAAATAGTNGQVCEGRSSLLKKSDPGGTIEEAYQLYHDEPLEEVQARQRGYIEARAELVRKQLVWTWFGVDKPTDNSDPGCGYTPVQAHFNEGELRTNEDHSALVEEVSAWEGKPYEAQQEPLQWTTTCAIWHVEGEDFIWETDEYGDEFLAVERMAPKCGAVRTTEEVHAEIEGLAFVRGAETEALQDQLRRTVKILLEDGERLTTESHNWQQLGQSMFELEKQAAEKAAIERLARRGIKVVVPSSPTLDITVRNSITDGGSESGAGADASPSDQVSPQRSPSTGSRTLGNSALRAKPERRRSSNGAMLEAAAAAAAAAGGIAGEARRSSTGGDAPKSSGGGMSKLFGSARASDVGNVPASDADAAEEITPPSTVSGLFGAGRRGSATGMADGDNRPASPAADMNVLELRTRLRKLTQQMLDGSSSAKVEAEYEELGELYRLHPDRDLTDEQVLAKFSFFRRPSLEALEGEAVEKELAAIALEKQQEEEQAAGRPVSPSSPERSAEQGTDAAVRMGEQVQRRKGTRRASLVLMAGGIDEAWIDTAAGAPSEEESEATRRPSLEAIRAASSTLVVIDEDEATDFDLDDLDMPPPPAPTVRSISWEDGPRRRGLSRTQSFAFPSPKARGKSANVLDDEDAHPASPSLFRAASMPAILPSNDITSVAVEKLGSIRVELQRLTTLASNGDESLEVQQQLERYCPVLLVLKQHY
jgi:hypothetical protein